MSTLEHPTTTVSCPNCGDSMEIRRPADGQTLVVRSSVAAFGEYQKVTCTEGDTFWVYYC